MARHPLLVALEPVADALGAETVAATEIEPGDIPLEWDGVVVGGFRLPSLHGALERLLARIAAEQGTPLHELSREDKQLVVQRLDEDGAFLLRRAVDEVADAIGVSRFTIYNYLNAREA
jgi:hypothetical protein